MFARVRSSLCRRGFDIPNYASTSSLLLISSRRFSKPGDAMLSPDKMRNIAIIAHVDHGKTTLVDGLLKQSLANVDNSVDRLMDSNDLEKERGITILSKVTSLIWTGHQSGQEFQFNIVDTPGHADFGGEVERVLSMVDGVALLVDASEGPMTQTKFVLSKALSANLTPIVVINKVDRPDSRVEEVELEVLELFDELGATEQQDSPDFQPLFEAIANTLPSPTVDQAAPFSMLVTQLYNHPFFGKTMVGKVQSGSVKIGDGLKAITENGDLFEESKVMKLLMRRGTQELPIDSASAGSIICLSGFRNASVNHTICDKGVTDPIKAIPIDPPSISMKVSTNDSPLAGQEGKAVTTRELGEWLEKEAETNVSLTVTRAEEGDAYEVFGRGELQLGVVVENMRRQGYEMSLSPPKVVFKRSKDDPNTILEPVEELVIDVDQDFTGAIIERMAERKGEMQAFDQADSGSARLVFHVPTRGLLGYRSEFVNSTRGTGTMNTRFLHYAPVSGLIAKNNKGALVSMTQGDTSVYALSYLEPRGTLFVTPQMKVYEGMVVGESSKEGDIETNPTKKKELNNIRTQNSEGITKLVPPLLRTLEEMIAYCRDDEQIEVTPKSVRLRKADLTKQGRKMKKRSAASVTAGARILDADDE